MFLEKQISMLNTKAWINDAENFSSVTTGIKLHFKIHCKI